MVAQSRWLGTPAGTAAIEVGIAAGVLGLDAAEVEAGCGVVGFMVRTGAVVRGAVVRGAVVRGAVVRGADELGLDDANPTVAELADSVWLNSVRVDELFGGTVELVALPASSDTEVVHPAATSSNAVPTTKTARLIMPTTPYRAA